MDYESNQIALQILEIRANVDLLRANPADALAMFRALDKITTLLEAKYASAIALRLAAPGPAPVVIP